MSQLISDSFFQRRTVRFFQQKPLAVEQLRLLIDVARQCSCAANRQELRYVVVQTPELVKAILPLTAWAAMVSPKRTPQEGITSPVAWIAVHCPAPSSPFHHADAGAAICAMELAAHQMGIGSCWLGAIQRPALMPLLHLTSERELLYLVALGYPAESPKREDVESADNLRYYLDEQNRLHVPKLTIETVSAWL